MKIGQRVQTPHGPGTVKVIEKLSDRFPRAGVLHDVFPGGMPRIFTDDILYYFFTELKILKHN